MAVAENTWRHRKACVEAKQSRKGDVSVWGSSKNLAGFTPEEYLGCVLHVRAFWSFAKGYLAIHERSVEGCVGSLPLGIPLCISHLEVLSLVGESSGLRERERVDL